VRLVWQIFLLVILLGLWLPTRLPAQEAGDGPRHPFQDALVDKLAGSWELTGTVGHQKVTHRVDADWVLNHQFLRVHEKTEKSADLSASPYEAIVMIGYDNASERYVAHWTDIYGGRFSETLGYGGRSGDEIEFVFEYPDGPFHTTFRWEAAQDQWHWLMRQKNGAGQWTDFADAILRRVKDR
jgi:hypothetical protein